MALTRTLIVYGTRPEAIKVAPVIRECRQRSSIDAVVCSSGQHLDLLTDVSDYFQLEPDFSLDIMCPNSSIVKTTASCLEKVDSVVQSTSPKCIVAQGDTLTVLAASMVAFFRSIPFVHIEAGLRTGDLYSPWPEEFNRRVTTLSTTVHCAPTQAAANNLIAERVDPATVHVTGNTVVDALLWTIDREQARHSYWESKYPQLINNRMVLITGHRRENQGKKFESIYAAIKLLSKMFPEIRFVYPVHPNPNVCETAKRLLQGPANIELIDPLSYPEFVWMMSQAELILTDSGGIQEEAPTLRKQVFLMRDTSERPEAVEAGFTKIVGCDTESIVCQVSAFLNGSSVPDWVASENPYGDGKSSARIADLIVQCGC